MAYNPLAPRGGSSRSASWNTVWTPGADAANLFNMYASLGDVTSSGPISIPSVLDGPGVVVRYNSLTLAHTLTTVNRCRSLTVLVDGNLTLNSGGNISMTARGARGHAGMGLYDGYIPASLALSSSSIDYNAMLQYIKTNGIDITDRWFWDDWGKIIGVNAVFTQGVALTLLSNAGCGIGQSNAQNTGYQSGAAGTAGTAGGPGGGGGGGNSGGPSYIGGKARPWGGGSGAGGGINPGNGGTWLNSVDGRMLGDDFGGQGGNGVYGSTSTNTTGGGAGNPGGKAAANITSADGQDGTGGILRIIVKGTITLNTGAIIQADGMNGGGTTSYYAGGGGSGGGHVCIIAKVGASLNTSFTGDNVPAGEAWNNGTIRANGGSGGPAPSGPAPGGAGGAGSIVTKTFAQMGW